MKRAQRFVCSTDSPPTISKTASKNRKRSRPSSARDGDLNAEPGDISAKRSAAKLPSGSPKTSRKATESPRVSISNFGSLQNAVVLAPFHTLKSSFQTKLVDLYSNERMKKIGNKNKTAKQQNSSFQYDVIELKSLGSTIKKEGKLPKKTKGKSRSASYCQCKRNGVRGKDSRGTGKKGARLRKKGGSEVLSRFSGRREVGRVRESPSICVPSNSRTDVPHHLDFYVNNEQPFVFTGSAPNSSAKSPRPRHKFRGTTRNGSPCNEGRMEGSFAISSTSFASYLKQFVRERPEIGTRRRDNTQKNSKRMKQKFLPKPNADSSRHLILRLEKKNSDEHIVHFMDREPQVGSIPSRESNHHLQPLRRQEREKEKKGQSDRIATYYLRSFSSSRDTDPLEGIQDLTLERRRRRSARANKISLTEVATQVGGNASDRNSSTERARSKSAREAASTSEARREKVFRDRPTVEPFSRVDCPPPLGEPAEGSELSDSLLCSPLISPVENPPDLAESVPGEPSDSEPPGLSEGLGFRLQEFGQSQDIQDKESDFIFGPSNAANRLGGSCEFSFGLNSVFPEDED